MILLVGLFVHDFMDVYRPGPSNCLDTPRMNQLCEHQDGILTNGSFHLPDGGFPGGSAGKESTCNAGDLGLIAGLGRSSGEGKGYPLQYSGLENFMDCIVHGAAKTQTQLNNFHSLSHTHRHMHMYTHMHICSLTLPWDSCNHVKHDPCENLDV